MQTGFSLIEIMVGMVIGLLGMMIMLQVYTRSESQSRTATGGDDAQNAAAIALYGLQRDIQQSGWGVTAIKLLGCDVQLRAGPPAVTITSIAPVTINHASITGQDANTDTLLIVYGRSNGGQEGVEVISQTGANNVYAVTSPNEFRVNDRVIGETSTRPSPCSLVLDTVTAVSNADVTVASAGVEMDLGNGTASGTLYNLGQTQRVLAYAIRNGNLTVCDYTLSDCGDADNNGDSAVWVPIANNIVSLKAQYGRDTNANPMDGIVNIYDTTTPATAASLACDWMKISSIRLALVGRNSQSRQAGVTPDAPEWAGDTTVAGAGALPGTTGNPIDLSLNPDGTANPDWQNYRYKVFQTIVPIRNINVKGVQTGC